MEALLRAIDAVPGSTASEYRVPGKNVALRVVSKDCPACSRFEAHRKAFESRLADVIFEVDVGDSRGYNLAKQSNVTKIPAYILLTANSRETITYPSL